MFAVPGWSVSADKLKAQQPEPAAGKSKKKRKSGERGDYNLRADDVTKLWEQHIEGKGPSNKRRKKVKGDKNFQDRRQSSQTSPSLDGGDNAQEERRQPQRSREPSKNKEQQNGRKERSKQNGKGAVAEVTEAHSLELSPVPAQPTSESKLTPMQARMREKLISSRFRYLNEALYTSPSSSSHDLFSQNPDFFTEYHEGFRRQVSAWPENPVDGFVKWLLDRGRIKGGQDVRMGQTKKTLDPLPRDASWCTIADLGCGDAKLAQTIRSSAPKSLKLDIHSFDLAAPNSLVTVTDIRSVPLSDASVDVAVFCLALMGTNWIEFVEEAYRILRWKGECWIAEVASRFGNPMNRKGGRVEHSVGKKVKEKGGKKGRSKRAAREEDEAEAEAEEELGLVEEATAVPRASTDVSAFVEVLRRRGFALQGEPETGNKMFVRMRFAKALPATRGKCAKQKSDTGKKPKFIDDNDKELTAEEEGRVLKPCVYKTR